MKKKKNTFAKVMAAIALFAIILGIIGTGVMVIVSSLGSSNSEITQEELEQYIETFSGSISGSGGESEILAE